MRKLSLALVIVTLSGGPALAQSIARSRILPAGPSFDLPLEPIRLQPVLTLADAARANDFPSFSALFASSEPSQAAPWSELHSFWQWSLHDPTGAFYGTETYVKFAARYPGYVTYIADFALIDSHARTFYPSAETRAFLLGQAESGAVPPLSEANEPVVPVSTASGEESRKPGLRIAPAASHTPRLPVTRQSTPSAAAASVKAAPVADSPVIPTATAAVGNAKSMAPPTARGRTVPGGRGRLGRGLVILMGGLLALLILSLVFSTRNGEELPDESESEPVEPIRHVSRDQKPKKTA